MTVLASVAIPAFAVISDLEITAAVSCNSVSDNAYFIAKFTEKFGQPSNRDGAYWFKASGTLYNSPIREVFVSSTSGFSFMGVVLEETPVNLVESIKKAKQFPANITPTNGYWVGSNGMQIKWQEGKYAKIFCNVGYER